MTTVHQPPQRRPDSGGMTNYVPRTATSANFGRSMPNRRVVQSEPVKLLWTGGWDSTFRLLDLVFNQGQAVEPHYLLAWRKRISAPVELETMERIRAAILDRNPVVADLVLPTRLFTLEQLPPIKSISQAFARVRTSTPLGDQYDWLARLAEHHSIDGLELAIHVDDRAFAHIAGSVRPDGDAMVLVDEARSTDLHIFQHYRFPVLHKTKRDMENDSRASGFHDIMMMTWFCFEPDRKGRPCGHCNPCMFAIAESMGNRISWHGHARYYLWKVARSIAKTINLRRLPIRHTLGGGDR